MANWYRLLRPFLFQMDPELAHERVLRLLGLCQSSEAFLSWLDRSFRPAPLPREVAGIHFPNPVGLAAGFDKDGRYVRALAALGFGFIEVGTVTRHPQGGNPRPRLFRYPEHEALVNRLGFNSCGADEAARALSNAPRPSVPVGVNLGKSAGTLLEEAAREYAECLEILYPHGDYFTLNLSSPNTPELRRLQEGERLRPLLEEVAGAARRQPRSKPIFLKVSPDASPGELEALAGAAVEFKLGLIATNTTLGREGLAGLEPGGLSGKPLRSRSTAVLRRLRELAGPRVPILGVGGILEPAHAQEKLDAGADLVQIYTGLIYRGPGLVREIVEALSRKEGRRAEAVLR